MMLYLSQDLKKLSKSELITNVILMADLAANKFINAEK